jgi:hypothetical protein
MTKHPARVIAALAMAALALPLTLRAQNFGFGNGFGPQQPLYPGNLLLSRSVYDNQASNVTVGEALPPNCVAANVAAGSCVTAAYDGAYPYVFNNAPIDGSFGITSRILIDQVTPWGRTALSGALAARVISS